MSLIQLILALLWTGSRPGRVGGRKPRVATATRRPIRGDQATETTPTRSYLPGNPVANLPAAFQHFDKRQQRSTIEARPNHDAVSVKKNEFQHAVLMWPARFEETIDACRLRRHAHFGKGTRLPQPATPNVKRRLRNARATTERRHRQTTGPMLPKNFTPPTSRIRSPTHDRRHDTSQNRRVDMVRSTDTEYNHNRRSNTRRCGRVWIAVPPDSMTAEEATF